MMWVCFKLVMQILKTMPLTMLMRAINKNMAAFFGGDMKFDNVLASDLKIYNITKLKMIKKRVFSFWLMISEMF